MDVCVVTYRNTAHRVQPALRPHDRLWVRDNTVENIGFARAANELAAMGDQPLILFVNPNGNPVVGCFEALERCFDDREVIAAEASQGPNWADTWGPDRFTWLSATCLAVRRAAFQQVGGFDSSLFMYSEDVDLSWKLRRLGRLIHCSEAMFSRDSTARPFRSMFYESRNRLLVHKHWRREASLLREVRGAANALSSGNFRLGAARCAGSIAYLALHNIGDRFSLTGSENLITRALPTRILHFAHIINRYDFIDNVVRHLDRSRFESEVCTFSARTNIAAPDYGQAAIYHKVLGVGSQLEYPAAGVRLARLLRDRGIDIIHAHHFDPNGLAWLATNLNRSTRVVVGRHYSDAIYLNSSGMKKRARLAVERLVHGHASRIVVPSTSIRDLLVTREEVPASKVTVIPYPFDATRYPILSEEERTDQRRKLGIDEHLVVATVGRLYKDKGHRYMIEALSEVRQELHDLVWLVVGDGPDRIPLEQAVRANNLSDRVRLLGWRTDALTIVGSVDAIVQPSVQEAYSQAMVEALWMRTPLVTTEVSGATDLITNGETGILVPMADSSALADALRTLYHDATLRRQLGDHGRYHVEENLSLGAIIPRFQEMYTELLAQ